MRLRTAVLAVVAGLLLAAVGDALAVQLTSYVAAVGGTGLVGVGYGSVLVESVSFLDGGNLVSNYLDTVVIGLRVEVQEDAGKYEVHVEVVNDGQVLHSGTYTLYLTTTTTTLTVSLPARVAQGASLYVEVYARRVG